ncbi:MAG: UDP-N-acetylmuramate dehydrogenase [Bacteroidetes bacterium]|nr:UDP-N-acetylmuramate dehydrogenase [Bacteroidota bacterium]
MEIRQNISLKPYNTFGIDVKAKYFAEYNSVTELKKLISSEVFCSNRHFHIGSGSNLLFLNDYDGLILHSQIKEIEKTGEDEEFIFLRAGSGMVWDDFVAYCVSNNYYGVENLSLIPGEIGASAVQNIGAYGMEVQDVIFSVEAIETATLQNRIFSRKECRYGYRKSIFKEELRGQYIITHVSFRLRKQPAFKLDYQHLKEAVTERGDINLNNIRGTVISIRQSKLPDPAINGNAGSFFMNPVIPAGKFEELQRVYLAMPHYPVSQSEVKVPAGWLIEQCGLKGKSFGRVGVHSKQALVIINLGNATGQEVADLAALIMENVWQKFGIEIRPEVNFI